MSEATRGARRYVGTTNLTPVDVGTCDVGTDGSMMEEYESVLVAVTGVSVSSENPDGPDNDYGEFEVDGCLRVDDLLHNGRCSDPGGPGQPAGSAAVP